MDSLTIHHQDGSRVPARTAARSGGARPQQDAAPNTCLKWGENGELSPVDLQRVLERLTDPSLTRCPLDV